MLHKLYAAAGCERGALAVWGAVAVPAMSLLAVGASELAVVSTERTKLQDVADAAALAGADQYGLGTEQEVAQRAKAFALAQAEGFAGATVSAETAVDAATRSVTVTLTSNRGSFFGNMLPPGGFTTTVRSTASAMGTTPLCVLATSATVGHAIEVRDSAELTAPKCMVQSNDDLWVGRFAGLTALSAHAAGVASGPITPAGLSGAKPMADPFRDRAIAIPTCTDYETVLITQGVRTLEPGVHCGIYIVASYAQLKLAPGAHYFVGVDHTAFSGMLNVRNYAQLTGDGVTLYFARTSKLIVQDQAKVDLKGAKSGPDAGMVIVADRANTMTFTFASTSIDRLEGVIYLPAARLSVTGMGGRMAEQSKWTISITRDLMVRGGPTLVINADYAGSDVPVPTEARSDVPQGSKLTS